jgi:GT2 family glycosyltransferase
MYTRICQSVFSFIVSLFRGCGRGESPANSLYLYSREVDYVSGCSLLMKKSDFIEAGQFPADIYDMYYEDTHLQMVWSFIFDNLLFTRLIS